MAIQASVAIRNAWGNAIPSTIGASAVMRWYTGTAPANAAAAATGTVLATLNLPATYFSAASSGAISLTGTWEDTSADGTGTAGYFRIYETTITTCGLQGTITATGGGGDITLDNTNIVAGQDCKANTFTLTMPGA